MSTYLKIKISPPLAIVLLALMIPSSRPPKALEVRIAVATERGLRLRHAPGGRNGCFGRLLGDGLGGCELKLSLAATGWAQEADGKSGW